MLASRATSPKILRDEQGSAVVDFIFVAIPMIAISLTSLLVIQAGYMRNIVLDAAVEGSRYAANADGTLAGGVARANQMIQLSLGSSDHTKIQADYRTLNGLKVAQLQVAQDLPVAGLLMLPIKVEVTTHATLQLQK